MADAPEPICAFAKPRKKSGKKSFKKKRSSAAVAAALPPTGDSDSEDEGGATAATLNVTQRRKHGGVSATSKRARQSAVDSEGGVRGSVASDRTIIPKGVDDATRRTDVDGDEMDRARSEYKGSSFYGPQKAAKDFVPASRFDYQPNVCKDYKETGVCGYGDACVFLHDRGNYKQGWQLDKEWDEEQNVKKERDRLGLGSDDESEVGDGLRRKEETGGAKEFPWGCMICRGPFACAIVTACVHYFCENCALKRYSKDKTCAICAKPTAGTFNVCRELRKMEKQELVRARIVAPLIGLSAETSRTREVLEVAEQRLGAAPEGRTVAEKLAWIEGRFADAGGAAADDEDEISEADAAAELQKTEAKRLANNTTSTTGWSYPTAR